VILRHRGVGDRLPNRLPGVVLLPGDPPDAVPLDEIQPSDAFLFVHLDHPSLR
jgi:hypothetical protein